MTMVAAIEMKPVFEFWPRNARWHPLRPGVRRHQTACAVRSTCCKGYAVARKLSAAKKTAAKLCAVAQLFGLVS